jgi:hypothetical protein
MPARRKMTVTLVYALPSLANVFFTAAIVLLIFAVVAMNLFSGVRYNSYITYMANFDSVGVGMLTLLRMSTGEAWGYIATVSQACIRGLTCLEPTAPQLAAIPASEQPQNA